MEMQTTVKRCSPADVADAVKIYLRRSGTLRDAAQKLGVAPTTLSTQLIGKAYLSDRIAGRLSSKFGFDPDFLTTGVGSLFKQNPEANVILPSSFTMRLEKPRTDPGEKDRVLWSAADSMCEKLNTLRGEYLSTMMTIQTLIGMITPESEEARFSERIQTQLEKVSIPEIAI